ncbi:MAG: TonB-dependent receptor [Chitinophagales bacterium]|nr:TonB-dependent receptor [Chitinophagales bacterium]
MLLRFCVFFLLLLTLFHARAQRSITLTDTAGKPVVDAYIVLYQLAGNGQETVFTDNNGRAQYALEGQVIIEARHMQFDLLRDTLNQKEAKYTLRPNNINLSETVITGQYMPVSQKQSLYPVQIIGAEKIERRAVFNLSGLLSQELNIRITQDNVLGSGLSLMGLGGEQVKYLLDGVPLLGRMNGDIDLNQINLIDVERIEIIEGPVSVLYGTNAMGGVINIITRTTQQQKVHASVGTYYESVGNYNVDASVGFYKKGHFLGLTGGRNFFDGFALNSGQRDQDWNPRTQYFGAVKYGYQFKRVRVLLNSNILSETISNKGNARAPLYVSAFDDKYNTIRWNNSLSVSGDLAKKHYFNVMGAYSFFERKKNTYRTDLTTLESLLVADTLAHDTSSFQGGLFRGYISRKSDIGMFNYQVGTDINIESGTGRRIKDGVQTIQDYAVFASLKFKPVAMLTIQPALRWAYNSSFKAPITPSLNIKISPSESWVVRLSYARGFRSPAIKELYLDFFDVNHNIYGNPDLKAEYSDNAMLSLAYEWQNESHRIKFNPSFYYNAIRNDIELVRDYDTTYDVGSAQPFTYSNFASSQVMGANVRFTYSYKKSPIVSVSSGFNSANYHLDENSAATGFYFSPEVSIDASYLIPKALLNVSLFYKFNGKLNQPYLSADATIGAQLIEAYHLMDITISRKLWKDRFTLSAGAKNLLDVRQVYFTGGEGGVHSSGTNYILMAWGRSYFVSLRFNFNS